MKFTKGSRFKRLARFALCLGLCVMMLGTGGVFGAVQAFADEVTHKYQLVDDSDHPEKTYGHVNWRYNETTGKWEEGHFKVFTKEGFNWGHGTKQGTNELYYVWHTANPDVVGDDDRLDDTGVTEGTADIKVYYDTKDEVVKDETSHRTSADGISAFVNCSDDGSSGYGGGALYNTDTTGKNIQADFIGNKANGNDSDGYGGAIENDEGTIGNITGDFIGNKANDNGGAIDNDSGTIGDIIGDFVSNSAYYGGAIENYDGGTIGNITGDFIGNKANGSGGAIDNDWGTIGDITGDFIGNSAQGDGVVYGGAIANSGATGDITGNFIGNFARATDPDGVSCGGAIANGVMGYDMLNASANGEEPTDIKSLKVVARGEDITFSGNIADVGGAIYNMNSDGNLILALRAEGEKSITFVGKDGDEKVDSVHNEGTMKINAPKKNEAGKTIQEYTGTVNFASITDADTPTGEMYIENGTVNFSRDVTQADIYFNGGYITMNDLVSSSPEKYRTLNIKSNVTANGGTFVIKTDLKGGEGDKITLTGTVSGQAKVKVAYDPFYETASVGDKQEGEHTFLTATNGTIEIKAQETKLDKGNGKTLVFTPTVTSADNQTWKITSLTAGKDKPKEIISETTKSVSDTANAINMAWFETTNNLQKRLGDLRGGEASNTGWARFQRSLDDLNNGRKLNVSGNLYQIGYDFALKNDTKNRSYLGLSLERFDGTQSYAIGGGDIKSTTLGAYYTKIYDSGHYFDFIFRYGRYESDTTSYDASVDNPVPTKLDYALNGVTLSGEYGYRANLGKSGLYLEPQAEFIYGYLAGAKKTSSTGILADIDSTNHFVSRLGLALGQRVKNFNYYLRGSYYHDFAGSTNITYGDASYKQDSAQNWWEVSLGGGWNMSDKSYFYAEFTKHFKDVSNSLNFNLGFRFTL